MASTILTAASYTVTILLSAVLFLLFARSILTILAPDSDHPVANVIFNTTDFLMSPARVLLDRTGWFSDSPLDMAHLITMVAVILIMLLFYSVQ